MTLFFINDGSQRHDLVPLDGRHKNDQVSNEPAIS